MNQKRFSGYFLFITIFTFIAIFIYVVQNSYSNLMKPITAVTQNPILKPIDSKMDTSILDQINNRLFFSDTSP